MQQLTKELLHRLRQISFSGNLLKVQIIQLEQSLFFLHEYVVNVTPHLIIIMPSNLQILHLTETVVLSALVMEWFMMEWTFLNEETMFL